MKSPDLTTNFVINVAGALAPLIISLATVPLYVSHIGDARYGVLSLVIVLLGYFGFLDLGLSRAAANALAKLRDAPHHERAAVLNTTLVLNLGLGLLGGLVIYFVGGYLLEHVVSVPEELKPEIASSFPWIAALFPMALVYGVAIGVLESRERFLAANVLQVVGGGIGQIVPVVVAVLVSPSLAYVIPAAAVTRSLAVVAILIFVYRVERPLDLTAFDRTQARRLLGYGGWISVSSVVGPLLTTIDQLVIGTLLGVAAVAHYAVPMNLVVRSQIFPAALARTLFPRVSSVNAADAHDLTMRAIITLGFGYAAVCAPALLLTRPFLELWIGIDFAAWSAPVGEILFPGAWINGIALVLYSLLQGQGRPDLVAKIHAAELIPFVGVLWLATERFGLAGAAVVWTLRSVLDVVLMVWLARLSFRPLAPLLVPAAVLLAALALARLGDLSHLEAFGAAVLAGLLMTGLSVLFSDDLRKLALLIAGRLLPGQFGGRLVARTQPDEIK